MWDLRSQQLAWPHNLNIAKLFPTNWLKKFCYFVSTNWLKKVLLCLSLFYQLVETSFAMFKLLDSLFNQLVEKSVAMFKLLGAAEL